MSVARYQPPRFLHDTRAFDDEPAGEVAAIYNLAGRDYVAYADGNPTRLFCFDGNHGYADQHVWHVLEGKLADLRTSGASSISLLDAGCGPGTWLRRMVVRALDLGFTNITARGFDIAQSQIQQARSLAETLVGRPGVHLTFDVGDVMERLPESDGSVDIALCLYSVLSHLPVAGLTDVSREIARVTSGHLVTAVRSIGSTPTAFIHPIEKIRYLRHDHDRNECEIELHDGPRVAFGFHLFTASELLSCFAHDFTIEEMRGLDLFHTRFAPDPRWNPASLRTDNRLSDELVRLEEAYARKSEFMDRAAHIMLVGRSRAARPIGPVRGP
jgi:SAM-dependent methyltransferase